MADSPKLIAIEGGDGKVAEPDWAQLINDELDIAATHEHWLTIAREMQEAGTLAMANAHQVKRLVIAYVMYDRAVRVICEEGPVIKAKKTRVPQYNPQWTILKDSHALASQLESELGLTPRRRGSVTKTQRQKRATKASDAYLRPVASG